MRTFLRGGVGGSAITSGLDRVRAILSDRKEDVPIYIITDPRNSGWKAGEEVDVWTLLLGCKGLDQADLPEWEPADYALKKPKSKRPSDYLEQLDEFRTILAFEFHTIYKGAVDERHLEMILRGMLRWPEKDLPYLTSVYGAHLEKEGFLAGASFRSCVDVLVRAALEGREDKIRGSKERLMVGRRV